MVPEPRQPVSVSDLKTEDSGEISLYDYGGQGSSAVLHSWGVREQAPVGLELVWPPGL